MTELLKILKILIALSFVTTAHALQKPESRYDKWDTEECPSQTDIPEKDILKKESGLYQGYDNTFVVAAESEADIKKGYLKMIKILSATLALIIVIVIIEYSVNF